MAFVLYIPVNSTLFECSQRALAEECRSLENQLKTAQARNEEAISAQQELQETFGKRTEPFSNLLFPPLITPEKLVACHFGQKIPRPKMGAPDKAFALTEDAECPRIQRRRRCSPKLAELLLRDSLLARGLSCGHF